MTYTAADVTESMDDAALHAVVLQHLNARTNDPDVWNALLVPALFDRTAQVLGGMRGKVEADIRNRKREAQEFQRACRARGSAARQEWFDYEAEWDMWRRRAVSFLRMVEARQRDAKESRRLTAVQQQESLAAARENYKARYERARAGQVENEQALRRLALAIRDHQALAAATGAAPTPQDRELWRVLDQVSLVVRKDGTTATLRNIMDVAPWADEDAPAELL